MKNLYTKNEFLTRLNYEPLNEGLLKNMWNNVMKLANNINGKKKSTQYIINIKNLLMML